MYFCSIIHINYIIAGHMKVFLLFIGIFFCLDFSHSEGIQQIEIA